MKTKKGYVLRSLGKEFILVAEGLEAVDANQLVSMNESAAFLWKALEDKEFNVEMMADLLADEYGIAREDAMKDVEPLLRSWTEAGVIVI